MIYRILRVRDTRILKRVIVYQQTDQII